MVLRRPRYTSAGPVMTERPWLVWVHGAGQGQPIDLLFSRARRIQDELGFNIALPVQPGHGSRRDGVADLSQHGSAEQRRGHDAGGVGGPRAGPMAATAVQRDRGVRCVDGKPGRCAGVASREGRRRSGLHADLRAQRDDRPTPRPVGTVGPRDHRAAAVRHGGGGGVRRRSPGCRTDAAPAEAASSSAPGTTGWRCASPLRCCTIGGAASCTGTREAMSGISSPRSATGVGTVPAWSQRAVERRTRW